MSSPSDWIPWFVVIWAVLFLYALVTRLVRLKGKPGGLTEPRKEEVLFDESYAGARSHKSLRTRFSGGTRCMRISVTRRAVLVRPHFPFSLVGVDADLVHDIPLSAISELSLISEAGASAIAVRYSQSGSDRRIDLVLKSPERFLSVVSGSRPK